MGTVTLTVEQLQDLLQAQTSQLEQHFTSQMAALQSNLEQSFETKLQAKFEQAEQNVKQFMKESIEEEDPDDAETTTKTTEDLQFLKDHVIQMEQSVSRIVMGDESGRSSTLGTASPHMVQRSASGGTTTGSTAVLERMVQDCCVRLEEIVVHKSAKWEQLPRSNNPRRTQSMDGSAGERTMGGVSALRASQQHVEDLLESRMGNLEQFIDSRHAELEAYYSSSNENLKKVILETVQGINASGGTNSGGDGDSSNALTKQELEAVLDARISAEEAEVSKALTREELEAVLDARITAEEEEQEQERQTQEPAESSDSKGGKSLHMAMGRLIQQQQEWIDIQSSTRDLEQQVQFKLDQLEGGGGPSLQRVESKLESLEKLVLAALANSATKKKQRSSSKKPTKKLSQLMGDESNENQNAINDATSTKVDDASSNANIGTGSNIAPRGSNAYTDISVDERRMEEEEENESEPEGDRVKSFMNTLNNWKELNEQQEDVCRVETDSADDIDEGDDDIDSNASMSVDSSLVQGGAGGGSEDDTKVHVIKTLQRLESKLDQLEEKIPSIEPVHAHHLAPPLDGVNRERSTNARHSREILVNTDSIEQSIRAEHSKLKRWILEQQDENNSSGRYSESGQATGSDFPNSPRSREVKVPVMPKTAATATAIDPKQLQSVVEKLTAIETLVSTNQSFLQETRRQAVPPVPKELPLVQPLGGTCTVDLERKILSHLDNMDKSVQFKLDEIYSQVRPTVKRRDSDWSTMSQEDQTVIVAAIRAKLQEIQEAITNQLQESIPDYGMAKSIVAESLEDMRQIVSEVAISEVELLKTQLGVAEEAEQEALHAILVMREQLEEAKESERRAKYTPQAAPQAPASTEHQSDGLWNFGPLGQLLGQQLHPPSSSPNAGMKNRFQSRKSIGQQSNVSGLSHHSFNNTSGIPSYISKYRSPKQKLDDWKHQISDLDDKAMDLRTVYSQLRGQKPEAGPVVGAANHIFGGPS